MRSTTQRESAESRRPRRAVGAATVALAVGGLLLTSATGASADSNHPKPPKETHGPCHYTETPDEPAARPVPLPPRPAAHAGPRHGRRALSTNQARSR